MWLRVAAYAREQADACVCGGCWLCRCSRTWPAPGPCSRREGCARDRRPDPGMGAQLWEGHTGRCAASPPAPPRTAEAGPWAARGGVFVDPRLRRRASANRFVPEREEPKIRKLAVTFTVMAALLLAADARTATPRQPSAVEAIRYVFGPYAGQALRVAWCESRYSIWARNGQYLGLFQMGDYARSRYGHAWNAWAQAISAWRYFAASGYDWSPWSCKP